MLGEVIQRPCPLKSYILFLSTEIILDNAPLSVRTGADHNVAQAIVVFLTRCTAANTDHESESNVGKRADHVGYCRRADESIF